MITSWHIGTARKDGKSFLVLTWNGNWQPANEIIWASFAEREEAFHRALSIFKTWLNDDRTNWDIVVFPHEMLKEFKERFPHEEEEETLPKKS